MIISTGDVILCHPVHDCTRCTCISHSASHGVVVVKMWAGLGPGLILIGAFVVKKISILFKFSNVNKLAVNRFGLWTVGQSASRAANGAGLAAQQPRAQCSWAMDFHIFQSTTRTKPETERAT